MANGPQAHWETIWTDRTPEEVSWFQQEPATSLRLLRQVTDPSSAVVDVGGGASRLVDGLLDAGYSDLTVVDIAAPALDRARRRLGERAGQVTWVVADATDLDLGRRVDCWHDRAVLHFLTDDADVDRYRQALRGAVRPGGHVVLATFAPDGPETCSGLPVRRYGPEALAEVAGPGFEPIDDARELHTTPTGATQQFQYVVLRRDPSDR